MELRSGYVFLQDVRFRAFHGVFSQERQVGNDYILNLRVGYPLGMAMVSDDVEDTLNYAALYELVRREMQQPSQLLEHVAARIADAICTAFPHATSIDLTLTKQNPPMGADCQGAGVEVHWKVED